MKRHEAFREMRMKKISVPISDLNEKSGKKEPEIRNCAFWRDLMLNALVLAHGTLRTHNDTSCHGQDKNILQSCVSPSKDVLYYVCDKQPYEDGRRAFSKTFK